MEDFAALLSTIRWAKFPKEYDSVLAFCDFCADCTAHTEIVLCGLGFFKLYLNGRLVSDELNNPVWSDYNPRNFDKRQCGETFSHRYYYRKYDITDFLLPGENRLAVLLGSGWYRQTEKQVEGPMQYGESLLLGFFVLANGERAASSEQNVYYKKSHITYSNIFYGEIQDENLYNKNDYLPNHPTKAHPAASCRAPRGTPVLQECPCDREVESLVPVLLREENGVKLYDAGVNLSGYAVIIPQSNRVEVLYGECLDNNGDLDSLHASYPDPMQRVRYENARCRSPLKPEFFISGFRYFSVDGGTAQSVRVVHTDIKKRFDFHCTQPVLQWAYEAYIRTQQSNYHSGVPSDCPHRERLGYTGDGQLTSDAAMKMFHAQKLYAKWIDDILDCQDRRTGHIQYTAPYYGGGGGPGGWGCAVVEVPFRYYKNYGDAAVLEKAFPAMCRWIRCMEDFSKNGLVVRDMPGRWCLGDWITPQPIKIPPALVNTYYYVKALRNAAEIAGIIGQESHIPQFKARESLALQALRENYLQNGLPVITLQGADVFLYDLGLLPGDYIEIIDARYRESGHFDTGIFGTNVLTDVLFEKRKYATAYRLLTAVDFPSFGYEMAHGATTFWEGWTGECSMNHPMFGAFTKHFFTDFAGINLTFEGGRPQVVLTPKLTAKMLPLHFCWESEWGRLCGTYTLNERGTVSAEICKAESLACCFESEYVLAF